jgi:hypothetical protein
MKKLVLSFLAMIAFATAGFAQQPISDPNAQVREAKNFHAISVSSAFNVYLTQGNEEKVAVSASEAKHLENIKVEVKNGVLEIGWDHKGKWGSGNKKLKTYISFKKIDKLTATGACDVFIVGTLSADDLKINLSGASDLKEGKITAKDLAIDMSGASNMKISGVTTNLKLDLSGACSFKGFELATNYCSVNASGASDIKITVNKELSADLSGASDVDYKGTGLIRNIKTSGASNVSKKDS